MSSDDEHLRLLAIFHYTFGGLALLFCCVPLLYAGFGVLVLTNALGTPTAGFPREFGWAIVAFGVVFFLATVVLGTIYLATGRFLERRVRLGWVQCVAAAECLFFPLGTTLGVLTLLVLSRDSVRQSFDAPAGVGDDEPDSKRGWPSLN